MRVFVMVALTCEVKENVILIIGSNMGTHYGSMEGWREWY